jgi:membrane protein
MRLFAPIRDAAGFLAFVLRRWSEDRCPQIAGSLTYTTLLALVPLFTIVVALLSSLPFFEGVMVQIKIFLLLNLVPDIAGRIITVYMEQFASNAGRLTSFGLAALFLMTIAMLFTVDHSLNAIWRVRQKRALWLSITGYTALLVMGPLLIGTSVWVTTYLATVSLGHVALPAQAESVVLKLVPITVSAIAFLLVYRIIPNRHVPATHAIVGGLLAAVLFEAMKLLFAGYIRLVPTYSIVYGAFAAIPIFLIWLYLSWLVVLFGAEFTAALAYWRGGLWRQAVSPAARLRAALQVGRRLVEARGERATLEQLRRGLDLPDDQLEDMLARMVQHGVARKVRRRGWALAKGPGDITLGDLHRAAHPGEGTLAPGEWAACSEELGRLAESMEAALRRPLGEVLADAGPAEPHASGR